MPTQIINILNIRKRCVSRCNFKYKQMKFCFVLPRFSWLQNLLVALKLSRRILLSMEHFLASFISIRCHGQPNVISYISNLVTKTLKTADAIIGKKKGRIPQIPEVSQNISRSLFLFQKAIVYNFIQGVCSKEYFRKKTWL